MSLRVPWKIWLFQNIQLFKGFKLNQFLLIGNKIQKNGFFNKHKTYLNKFINDMYTLFHLFHRCFNIISTYSADMTLIQEFKKSFGPKIASVFTQILA